MNCEASFLSFLRYLFFAVVIAFNTCVMASEYYGMSQLHADLISYCNSILTLMFTTELILKLMGLGARNYLNSIGNIFDALLVDEAHRLNYKSGLYQNLGENQILEIINAFNKYPSLLVVFIVLLPHKILSDYS